MGDSHGFKAGTRHLWSRLASLPRAAGAALSGFTAAWLDSSELRRSPQDLHWNESAVQSILEILNKTAAIRRMEHTGGHPGPTGASHIPPIQGSAPAPSELSSRDHLLLQRIRENVQDANKSNITRTRAYLQFYEAFPEVHWALLAHMVSRNAGWNMTDLKSGLMSDLVKDPFKDRLYRFLERCNALIFQDAYPQLLLYQYSREQGRSCFHLLPHFHISSFMTPFWERFWLDRSSSPVLTVALIINEQNYIEGRVVQNPMFRQNVLDHPSMKLFDIARLNQVLFPLGSPNCRHDLFRESILPLRPLAGLTMRQFKDVAARIRTGKALYAMLFGYKDIYEGVMHFARCTDHHGSRSEYWPALFTSRKQAAMAGEDASLELLESEWRTYGDRLYSPRLEDVWYDNEYEPIPRYDWFQSTERLSHLKRPSRPLLIDMTHAHRFALERIAFAHDAEEQF
ncbi:DUF2515 family protein [Paenibacillus sp. FSL M8-0334]|uniref:DUF2515 domain-containing protein n=1 Tax=Paenibacillus campinasensis TaxID=66347 RepID=A0ABW9T2Y2_9BACL|nr:DUF2515 family protein [Paenibacillus campinasensis]MUG66470.1 DUF2515 domain-containing protein [Paenibacillus campinasensis]